MKIGRIQATEFILPGWDIIFVSHGLKPIDILVFLAESNTSALKSENYDIINFDRHW